MKTMAARLALMVAVCTCVAAWSADEPKPVALSQIVLYVPVPVLEERLGKDVRPLANYIKALEKRAEEVLSEGKQPEAKGLLVVVGIKSRSDTRIWCQAVDGKVAAELLQRLEEELAKVEAVDIKQGAASFAMQVNLFGQKPKRFPRFPDVWLEEAEKSNTKLMIPPDELFERIWPD
jgi:phosphotransferase system HPr-like phosphotransfer protein